MVKPWRAKSIKFLRHVVASIPESSPTAFEKSRCGGGWGQKILKIAKGENLCARKVNPRGAGRLSRSSAIVIVIKSTEEEDQADRESRQCDYNGFAQDALQVRV